MEDMKLEDSLDLSAVWLPFTNMKKFMTRPMVIRKASGPYVLDNEGRELFDCVSSLWHASVGHGPMEYIEKLVAYLHDGVSTGSLFGALNEPAIKYAMSLLDFIGEPHLKKVFFSNGGSDAVETALKLALQYHYITGSGQDSIVYLKNAYHGVTMGALSAMGIGAYRTGYEGHLSKKFIPIASPHCYRCEFSLQPTSCGLRCADQLEEVIASSGGKIGALIMEPVQGAGGIIVPPEGYRSKIRDICSRHGILLICDEVVTGMYRCGDKFAFQKDGLAPDILVLSKAIGGGVMPLGVCVVAEKIYDAFEKGDHVFAHGNTCGGNPLSAMAGRIHLDRVSAPHFAGQVQRNAKRFADMLEDCRSIPIVGDVRYDGMMGALELVSDREQKTPLTDSATLAEWGRDAGLFLRPLGHVVSLLPPLNLTDEELDEMQRRLKAFLQRATANCATSERAAVAA